MFDEIMLNKLGVNDLKLIKIDLEVGFKHFKEKLWLNKELKQIIYILICNIYV